MYKVFDKPGVFVASPDFADAEKFATTLQANGFGWVAVQIHNGTEILNVSWLDGHNWPAIMRSHGISFGLWGYNSSDPVQEAQIASDYIGRYDDPGHSTFYIANPEVEYTGTNRGRSAQFVGAFRKLRPTRQAAMSSFGAAVWDNNLATVFDYAPWQIQNFDFMPQAYFNQAAEYEPSHCVEQALSNGWAANRIKPTIGIFNAQLGRRNGDEYAYLIRNCQRRFGIQGWSVYNAENLTGADLAALKLVA